MKKTYQIHKQRAVLQFQQQARSVSTPIQFALPLSEVVSLAQQGLMCLALAAFTQLAERMMRWEVEEVVGPKNKPLVGCERVRCGSQGVTAWWEDKRCR